MIRKDLALGALALCSGLVVFATPNLYAQTAPAATQASASPYGVVLPIELDLPPLTVDPLDPPKPYSPNPKLHNELNSKLREHLASLRTGETRTVTIKEEEITKPTSVAQIGDQQVTFAVYNSEGREKSDSFCEFAPSIWETLVGRFARVSITRALPGDEDVTECTLILPGK